MTHKSIDLLINAYKIIPIVPENTVLSDCSLAINDGIIVSILPTSEAHKRFKPDREVNLGKHIVMPGLINAHTHAAMSLLRGYADDQPLKIWLEQHIWPAESQWVSEEFVKDGFMLAAAEMIRSGTTTFSDMYFFPDTVAKTALEIGLRAQICFPVMDFPTPWGTDPDDYIDKGLKLHDAYRSQPTITVGFGPHAPYTVNDDALRKIAILAEELQAPIQIHLHETASEVSDAESALGKRPIERLNELGILSPLAQCVHMTEINALDIELLQQSGAHVVHCPESNLKLASGFCPVQKLKDQGINVALGTDGAASNNDLDMFGEMRTAALLAKGVSGYAAALNAHSALRMATLDGAKARGQESTRGALEAGKAADIVAISIDNIESMPLYDPASHLVYTNCSNQVSDLWVNGQQLLSNRELQTIDISDLRHKVKLWQERIGKTKH